MCQNTRHGMWAKQFFVLLQTMTPFGFHSFPSLSPPPCMSTCAKFLQERVPENFNLLSIVRRTRKNNHVIQSKVRHLLPARKVSLSCKAIDKYLDVCNQASIRNKTEMGYPSWAMLTMSRLTTHSVNARHFFDLLAAQSVGQLKKNCITASLPHQLGALAPIAYSTCAKYLPNKKKRDYFLKRIYLIVYIILKYMSV